jgi:hypothetical protein
MAFRLPVALQTADDEPALELLRRYYGQPYLAPGCADGAYFDTWCVEMEPDKFTADDLIAIKFLSVDAPKAAARDLLRERAQHFAALLIDLGRDRDLALETSSVGRPWPGWTLLDELKEIPGVGTTIATKLLARKRPKLVPIWDSVVAAVTDTVQSQWEPLRLALGANDSALHHRLIGLRDRLRLPKEISALRVLDVIAWREGKDRGL